MKSHETLSCAIIWLVLIFLPNVVLSCHPTLASPRAPFPSPISGLTGASCRQQGWIHPGENPRWNHGWNTPTLNPWSQQPWIDTEIPLAPRTRVLWGEGKMSPAHSAGQPCSSICQLPSQLPEEKVNLPSACFSTIVSLVNLNWPYLLVGFLLRTNQTLAWSTVFTSQGYCIHKQLQTKISVYWA